jgi:multidrug efflux system membrane fusion protein
MMIGFLAGAAAATGVTLGAVERSGKAANGTGAARVEPAANAVPVPVTPVVKRSVPIMLDYVGRTEAIRTVTLQAKATGYLARQAVPDGADVKREDLLYVLDQRDYQAALDQSKAQAAKDAAALDYARVSQGRNAVLTKQGWVAKDVYDQVTASMRQSEAALQADRAAMQTAELNLGYTEIRAPFDGRLGRSQVHEGALITVAGTSLNTLVELDPIYATFNPTETDLSRITSAADRGPATADILLGGDGGTHLAGRLAFLDNAVDRATGTVTARVIADNPGRSVLPGQYVRVRLHVGDLESALLVPQAALGSTQVGKFVYVVSPGNKAEQRYVSLGQTDGDLVVITKGVSEGDQVIVGNLQKLGPGALVQPRVDGQHAVSPLLGSMAVAAVGRPSSSYVFRPSTGAHDGVR